MQQPTTRVKGVGAMIRDQLIPEGAGDTCESVPWAASREGEYGKRQHDVNCRPIEDISPPTFV